MTTEELTHPLRAAIHQQLDAIKDPCSIASGCPLGLIEMGLVARMDERDGVIHIGIRLTSPGCHFTALILQEIEERLSALPGVRAVHADTVPDYSWSEDDISVEGRARLRENRAARARRLKELTVLH